MKITVIAENGDTGATRILGEVEATKKEFNDFQARRIDTETTAELTRLYNRIVAFHVFVNQGELINYRIKG
jgi:uncharacterized protein YaeQ